MRRILLVLVVSLFAIASLVIAAAEAQTETAQNRNRSIDIPMSALNNSNESGTATLTMMGNNQTKVTLKMNNAPSNDQPAHIHSGSCPNPGAVKYSLNPVRNGTSETTLNVSLLQLWRERPLAINVHKSSNEMNVNYSCGDIERSGGRQSVLVDSQSMMEGMDSKCFGPRCGAGYDYDKDGMMKGMKEHRMKCECWME